MAGNLGKLLKLCGQCEFLSHQFSDVMLQKFTGAKGRSGFIVQLPDAAGSRRSRAQDVLEA